MIESIWCVYLPLGRIIANTYLLWSLTTAAISHQAIHLASNKSFNSRAGNHEQNTLTRPLVHWLSDDVKYSQRIHDTSDCNQLLWIYHVDGENGVEAVWKEENQYWNKKFSIIVGLIHRYLMCVYITWSILGHCPISIVYLWIVISA